MRAPKQCKTAEIFKTKLDFQQALRFPFLAFTVKLYKYYIHLYSPYFVKELLNEELTHRYSRTLIYVQTWVKCRPFKCYRRGYSFLK